MARLATHYGSPDALYSGVPIGVLNKLDEHLPCVEAERLLGLFSVLQVAVGRVSKEDGQRFLRDLRQRARSGRPERAIKATEQDLAAMGISMHHKDREKT